MQENLSTSVGGVLCTSTRQQGLEFIGIVALHNKSPALPAALRTHWQLAAHSTKDLTFSLCRSSICAALLVVCLLWAGLLADHSRLGVCFRVGVCTGIHFVNDHQLVCPMCVCLLMRRMRHV